MLIKKCERCYWFDKCKDKELVFGEYTPCGAFFPLYEEDMDKMLAEEREQVNKERAEYYAKIVEEQDS